MFTGIAARSAMMSLALGVACVLRLAGAQAPAPPRPGPAMGCTGIPATLKPGGSRQRQFHMTDPDPRLGTYNRKYLIQLPEGYTGTTPVPVLFFFHGWGGTFKQMDYWTASANENGYIMVLPSGEDDGSKGQNSWNVGHAGRYDVCDPLDTNDTTVQYTSCTAIGATSPCNCYTCYDDVQFVADLYGYLSKELCVDDSRIYASGASNGAMFLYPLVAQLERRGLAPRFKAIVPWYGAFLANMQDVPAGARGLSILHPHGTRDTEVTTDGSESADGWFYVPVDTTLGAYASLNGCGSRMNISTPWDGYNWSTPVGDRLERCHEYKDCDAGRVVRCDFHEQHGFWPSYATEIMWWFFSSLESHTPALV